MFNQNITIMSNFLAEISALPKQAQKVFNNKTEIPTYTNLQEGEHRVKINELKVLFSDKNWDGSAKDKSFPYKDKTMQIGYRLVSVEGNGSIIGRHNLQSFVRTGDLTTEQLESGEFHDVEGYACREKDGVYTRILSTARQEKNQSLQNSITYAIGEAEQEFSLALNEAMEKETEFIIKVVKEAVPGKSTHQMVVKSWSPAVSAEVDAESL
jgi:hypothetical protein